MSYIRYIVAHPRVPDVSNTADVTNDKSFYWYKWEAERAAKIVGGWVIEIDLRTNRSNT